METAMSSMGSLLPKLRELLRDDERCDQLLNGSKEDVELLLQELTRVHAALREFADDAVTPNRLGEDAKAWAGDARELAYDAEDAVDASLARADPAAADHAGGGFKGLLERATDLSRTRPQAAVVDPRIPAAVVGPRPPAPFKDATEIVGLDAARDALMNKLCDDGDGDEESRRRLKVVSIVGFAGLGKTTLAKIVYDTLKPRFDCGAFVSVSINPDMAMVLETMLRQLDEEKYASVGEGARGEEPQVAAGERRDETQLLDELRQFLGIKRYLIVIDDIWDKLSWEIIKGALVDNNCGSRIVTTTRRFDLAEQVGTPYELKPLSHDNSKILFLRRIFGNSDKNCLDDQFTEVADKIVKKCGGVPLSIIAVGSLLAGKVGNISEWYKVHDSIYSRLEDSNDVNNVRMALSLGYYSLPSHLRACLLYLSIFPEDYEIRRDRLIWRWIAEDFIQDGGEGESLFEIGESYFDELVNRSMVQLLDIDYSEDSGRAEYCCYVHFSVMDLIRPLSTEENFVTVLDDEKQTCLPKNVRRLSIRCSKTVEADETQAPISILPLRSISVFCPANGSIGVSRFPVLRVLDLEGCDLSESHDVLNNHIGSLLELRYLGLRDTKIPEVHEDIGSLRFLQTLDLAETKVKELPDTIIQLKRLLCLHVDYHTRLPRGMWNLASLEVLSDISTCDSPDIVKELGKLTELRVLKITLWKPTQCMEEALVDSLRNLHKLRVLDIYAASVDGSKRFQDVVREAYVPPQSLRVFSAEAMNCWWSPLRLLPAWINTSVVPCLSVLLIQVMELRQEDIDTLGALPVLRTLRLEPYEMKEAIVVSGGTFPFLRECRFRNSDLGPVIRHGGMPRLRILEFCFSVRKTKDLGYGFDFGLANLGSLEEATVYIRCSEAWEVETDEAEAAMSHATDTHPNRATFDVITFGEELMRFDDD